MFTPRYKLSDGIAEMFDLAKEEPYKSINRNRGTSIEYFEYILGEADKFIQRFEEVAGLNGTSEWRGMRLHECKYDEQLSKTAAHHIVGDYFSHLSKDEDAAVILLENYGCYEDEEGTIHYHTYTMPHLAIIRPVHIDAKKHVLELQLPSLMKKAEKNLKQLNEKSGDPGFLAGLKICEYFKNMYHPFADIMHSLAVTYFEIENYKSNASMMACFDNIIELPPHQSVIDALNEAQCSCPINYKLNEQKQIHEKKSLILKNLSSLDLDELSMQCLESARRPVKSISVIRDIFSSLAESDFERYEDLFNEFRENQPQSSGFFSAFDFLVKEKEHVVRRHEI